MIGTGSRALLGLVAAISLLQGCGGGPAQNPFPAMPPDSKQGGQASAPEQPGFERVEVTRTRDDGSLRWVLKSDKGTGSGEGDWTCDGVDLTLYDERQRAYRVVARHGEVAGTQQKGAAIARLEGEVTLLTEDGARIVTDEATWNEEAQTLLGNKAVRYDKENVSCTGNGFVAKYADREVEVFDVVLNITENEGKL